MDVRPYSFLQNYLLTKYRLLKFNTLKVLNFFK